MRGIARQGLMWKRVLIILFALLLVNMPFAVLICCAGDIPEALLGDMDSLVYFGEVKCVDEEYITVIQYQNIKGEFETGKEYTYPKFVFTETPQIGEVYLCGYLDENNPLYIWEVSSLDPVTLKLFNKDDMSKRMQGYLNDGSFEKAAEKIQEIARVQAAKDAELAKRREAEGMKEAVQTNDIKTADMQVQELVAENVEQQKSGLSNGLILPIAAMGMLLAGVVAGFFLIPQIPNNK